MEEEEAIPLTPLEPNAFSTARNEMTAFAANVELELLWAQWDEILDDSASSAANCNETQWSEPLPLSEELSQAICEENYNDPCAMEVCDTLHESDLAMPIVGIPWLVDDAVTRCHSVEHVRAINSAKASAVSAISCDLPANAVPSKRRASDAIQPDSEPAVKATRALENEPFNGPTDFSEDSDGLFDGSLHKNIGLQHGRYHCSCGKSYTRAFRLRHHLNVANGVAKYYCFYCDQSFSRMDSVRRHEGTIHGDKKVTCPGCRKSFRADSLRAHLTSTQNLACRTIETAMGRWTHGPEAPTDDISIPSAANEHRRTIELLALDSNGSITVALPRPCDSAESRIASRVQQPCDLCGMPLGPSEQELIDHIAVHSMDFFNRPHKCHECDIDFAFVSDFRLHRMSAASGRCGFHSGYVCNISGHHPPKLIKWRESEDDYSHKSMLAALLNWEIYQIRAHRVNINYMLNECPRSHLPKSHSLDNVGLHVPRLSLNSIESFHSVPAWLQYMDKITLRALELEDSLRESAIRSTPDDSLLSNENNRFGSTELRPRSRPSGGAEDELNANEREQDFVSAILGVTASFTSKMPESERQSNSVGHAYVEQLKAVRAPGGMRSTASGVKYRAKAATRYLLPRLEGVLDVDPIETMQCAVSA